MTIAPPPSLGTGPGALTDEELQNFVASSLAGCADTLLDPDEWFPVSAQAARARAEASRALAVCTVCPIQAECLELSLRTWSGAGRYGIWGGLLEAERNSLRHDWRQGVSVPTLLSRRARPR
jgi:WhiB family redox-sensing transcriptional regulator